MRLNEAIGQYLDHLRVERALARNTLDAYAADLNAFAAHVGDESELRALGVDAIASMMKANRRGLSPRSSARQFSVLRGFSRFLLRERLIALDPTKLLDPPKL